MICFVSNNSGLSASNIFWRANLDSSDKMVTKVAIHTAATKEEIYGSKIMIGD